MEQLTAQKILPAEEQEEKHARAGETKRELHDVLRLCIKTQSINGLLRCDTPELMNI